MLKALLKSRFSALLASMSQSTKGKKKRTGAVAVILIIVFALLAVYMIGAVSIMFFGVGYMLNEQGNEWAFFTIASLVSSALCMLGSIFTTKTQIFESKDNELLLSMPIPPKYILISRILILLIVNYILEALIMIPAIVMYGITCGYTVLGFVFAISSFILIPFLSLAVSAIIAWIISYIASKIRNKTLVSTALFTIFFVVYMYFCFSLGTLTGSGEELDIDVSGLKNAFTFYHIGNSIANESWLHFLYFALMAIVPAIITFALISYSFIRIITTKKTAKKVVYKEKNEKSSSPMVALIKKEAKRFFTSTAYMMNCGMGIIMMAIVTVVATINSGNILSMLDDPTVGMEKEIILGLIPVIIVIFASMMCSMCMISTPSISLENKSMWILQSLPVRPRTILFAKILNHIIISAPVSLISVIVLCIAFKVDFISSLLVAISTITLVALTAYFGMFLGLKFPKFDWQNENVAVKQGFAIFGTMLGFMIYSIIQFVVGMFLGVVSSILALSVIAVLNIVLLVLLHLYFIYGSEKDFEKLKDKQ